MEPIFFEPLYKHNVWGGYKISEQLKNIDKTQMGESWEISANKNGICTIKNGEFKGKNLKEVFDDKKVRVEVFGEHCRKMKKFPLLIKFIDAQENLSVQVHPSNFYAKNMEKDTGKKEMWYVLDCKKNSKIIYGFNDKVKSKKDLKDVNEDNILSFINYVPIKKGDAIFIDSGTIHSIMGETMVCEIQQNSDITYRVYDWGRNDKNRPLHLKRAKKVINVNSKANVKNFANTEKQTQKVFYNKFFSTDKIKIDGENNYKSNKNSFQAITVMEGNGRIICNGKSYEIKKGDSFLIPAKLGKYTLEGNLELLKTIC